MSNERQETISDIFADIRAQNQGLPEDDYALSPLVCDLLSLADRIEAAAKREREARDKMAQSDIDSVGVKYGRLVKKLRSENERLLSALKPVLEVGWVEKRYNYCSGTVPTKDLYLVVREAQGIYNGGAK